MKTIRTDPRNHAAEGDERIRTAVARYSVIKRYESAPPTTIYFVQDELGPIKIGHACKQRLARWFGRRLAVSASRRVVTDAWNELCTLLERQPESFPDRLAALAAARGDTP